MIASQSSSLVFEEALRPAARYAGVTHHHIDATGLGHCVAYEHVDIVSPGGVRNVEAAAVTKELGHGIAALIWVGGEVSNDNKRAFIREAKRDRAAEPGRPARDDDRSPLQATSHRRSLRRTRCGAAP